MLIYMTPQIELRIHDFVLSNGYRSIPKNTIRYMVFARLYMYRLVRGYKLLQHANKSWFTVTEILQKSVLNTITLAPQKKNQENHTIDIIYPQIFIHHSILILILLIFQYCVSAIEISMLDFLSGKSFLWNLKAFLNQFKLKAMAVCAKNHQP